MLRGIRAVLVSLAVLLVAGASGCAGCTCLEGQVDTTDDEQTTSSTGGGGGAGGQGGSDLGPCGMDCSALDTPTCTMGVCNTGQEIGPLNTCVVVPSPKGTACDDDTFCTVGDFCDGGACVGGATNDCGLAHSPCEAVLCSEPSKSCSVTPVNDGTACIPTDLCQVNGVCQVGQCVGEPKKCGLSPLGECNTMTCDPATGCTAVPDPFKDNKPCVLTGDLCKVDKACQSGQCVGGTPKDCSGFDVACEVGTCDAATGICGPVTAPVGTSCADGITQCQVGSCDANGTCKSSAAPNGLACNDHDACSAADQCNVGACVGGAPVAGCALYFKEGFEVCPNGWTLAGDWECGKPQSVGPPVAHTGTGVMATKIAGVYSVSQSFTTDVADSPPIDLTLATNPMLSFWAWVNTEGGTFDGWNLKVSTDGGQNFAQVTTVTPAYPLTISGQPAWGGDHSAEGWQSYAADLTAYAGQTIILRFAFRSDAATVYPGVYLDDLFVAEPLQNPLYITTSSLPDVYAGKDFSATMTRTGGTSGAVWSIEPGGVNTGWLTMGSMTGVLSGTPTVADVGPVSVTVRVQEPTLPSNFDLKTLTFKVVYDAYYTSFEDPCPSGWTLAGDWQCGVPITVGPATAYLGTQCIATQIGGNYSNFQSFAAATATSPDIDLGVAASPAVSFRMWIATEGPTHDGVNLKISTDGGMNYAVVGAVTPAYPLVIAGEPAWGGHQSGLGWQLMQANLSAYAGQIVRLQLSFRSDSSATFPGVYIDDFLVH